MMSSFDRNVTLGQPGERVNGVDVRPLEILEHKDQRQVVGKAASAALNSSNRRTGERSVPPANPLRKLRQPGRRMLARMRGTKSQMPPIERDERVEER